MSQEKVAKYKEAKANRKETMKKEKQAKMLRNSIAGLIVVAVVGWIGFSAVDYFSKNTPRTEVEVDYSALQEYSEVETEE